MGEISHRKRVVMLGGGHAHLMALRQLATAPPAGLDITLVSRHDHSVYSGMIPGVIAGHYDIAEAQINLPRLCQNLPGLSWRRADVNHLDSGRQLLHCRNGDPIPYDILSIDTGAETAPSISAAGACGVVAVKPVEQLVDQWQPLCQRISRRLHNHPHDTPVICIVGGGAAAVEVALALVYRLQRDTGGLWRRIQWQLVSAGDNLLPSHNRRVQSKLRAILQAHGFHLQFNTEVRQITPRDDCFSVVSEGGAQWTAHEVIQATRVRAPDWLQGSALQRTQDGFLRVNGHLQSLSHPTVFATGDIAHFEPRPLPKSGVYAVRQGKTLAANLLRLARGEQLLNYRPQRHCLSLVSLGQRRAIASRGKLSACGAWVWHWKNRIDRRFIAQFKC